MRKGSKTAVLLGSLFLTIGALWLSVIFIRCDGPLLWERTERVEEYSAGDSLSASLQDLPIRKFLSKAFIVLFWVIACLELACALFYLTSGISLLRAYPFGRQFAFLTLITDAVLKVLIVVYQWQVVLPLKDIFRETNILLAHFAPDGSFVSQVSAYLTGVQLIRSGALYYAILYAAFLIGLLRALVPPKLAKE
jgi:hypothetical protein